MFESGPPHPPYAGKPHGADGPYTKSSRQAGAFFIIDAGTPEEARQVASKHAAANFGEHLGFAVEVRGCEMYEKYS